MKITIKISFPNNSKLGMRIISDPDSISIIDKSILISKNDITTHIDDFRFHGNNTIRFKKKYNSLSLDGYYSDYEKKRILKCLVEIIFVEYDK